MRKLRNFICRTNNSAPLVAFYPQWLKVDLQQVIGISSLPDTVMMTKRIIVSAITYKRSSYVIQRKGWSGN
jgi:hypothetical protein